MSGLLLFLQYAVNLAFVILGLLTLRDWLVHRERSRGYLALAIGLLAITALIGQVQTFFGNPFGEAGTDVDALVFLASAYAMLLFRSSFIPLSRRGHLLALGGLALAGALFIGANLPQRPEAQLSVFQQAVVIVFVLAWAACVGEPLFRFLQASQSRPAVQRARLRSLAAGYLSIFLILLVAAFGGSLATHPYVVLAIDLAALASVPLIYASFAPPSWLRRLWREPEESAFAAAVKELLLFSPTRERLAERAVEWALRLVGADAAFIADADGEVLAARGMDAGAARRLQARLGAFGEEQVVPIPDGPIQSAIVVPLTLADGNGALVVLSGPFTPIFGTDEVTRLGQYGTNITAGLDRAVLTERIAALERTKTEFLNLASHELRGPITVLRGYLSMLGGGMLGGVSPELREVLPVLTAKSDEMNSLIEQMIEAARLEEGRLELSPVRADLRDIALRALETVKPFATSSHPVLFEGQEKEIPVLVDRRRIETVVSNLLSNAIKYSPDGGEVRISFGQDNGFALLKVTDRGVGIDPKNMEKLFTRFGRIVTPSTRHISGTGLGLYLSRELARRHGGDITAESAPGKGSTFVLTVPVADE